MCAGLSVLESKMHSELREPVPCSVAVCWNGLDPWLYLRFAQYLKLIEVRLKREALTNCCQRDDHLALLPQVTDNTFDALKHSIANPNLGSNHDAGMGPQRQSLGQTSADFFEFLILNKIPRLLTEQAKHAGRGNDRDPGRVIKPCEDISRKKGPFRHNGSVRPSYFLFVEREIVFNVPDVQVLRNLLFMVGEDM
jgi:hypothetical protein